MSTDKPDLGPDDNPMPVWMGELCERFKDAWGSKNPISVESIVERIPADRRTVALQTLVEAEYVLRSATNDGLTAKELARRFPNDADLVLNIHRRLAGYSSPSNRETIAPKNAPSNNDVETGSKTLQIPRQLGRYRIVRKLGQGAMGSVFLAKDEQLDRQVALKFPRGNLQQGGEQQARFLQEARAAAALHHANICPIYDAGEIQGINYICMGYVDGAPLSQFAVQDSGLTEQQIARIILQIAKAVAAAHGAGFIHRDLKPANIMIDLNNEPVILDFGLARRINRKEDQRVTQAGAIMGSPCYMSPEQVDGDEQRIGPQSDVYSLGVILYELLSGRVPFEGSFASVMGQIMTKIPDKPSSFRKNLSVRLETICNKMMAKQQDQRFPSMAAVADALQEYLDKFDGPDSATADGNTNETAPTNKGEQRKQHIEQLIKASDYGPAETLLVSLSRETSDALQSYAVWAAAELPKLRKLREQVRAGRQDIYETATRLMKTYDYEQVVRLLSDYPYDIRTPNMQQLLERAERLSNDVERLSKGIAAARTRGDNDTLMKLLQEKLKLKPHDREAKELYDQLLRRSEGPISKVLGGNAPRSVRAIPASLQWLMIFVLVVPMCAVPAYMWAQGYLARKSEKSERPIPFIQQEFVKADDANAPEPPKPDENQPQVPPKDDADPPVGQQPESTIPANVESQPAQAPPTAIAPFDAAQAALHQQEWAKYLKVPVEVTNSIGMKLKIIPAGKFKMGGDKVARDVTLTQSYYMGMYEVTQEQYERVMKKNPSRFKGVQNPVEEVSWDDAVEFCRQLSLLPDEKTAGHTYRLPTEAEWEHACRAGTTTSFSFGDDASQFYDYGWASENSGNERLDVNSIFATDPDNSWARLMANDCQPHPVGTKLPNPWGLYDMHGNTFEWCQDLFANLPTDAAIDPRGPESGENRVIRGGSWINGAGSIAVYHRDNHKPSHHDTGVGFRVVLSLNNPNGDGPTPANKKSPLFTELDREALLAVGCKPQEANGDSNFIAVQNAKLTPAVADAIRHMEQLQGLSLQKSIFDNEQLARIGYRPSFVQLWLWDSNLDAKGFVTVCSNFPNLNFISIQGVKPRSIDIFRNIQKLDKLTSLGAGWSGINHDDLEVIVKLPKLETLHLQGTKIVDRDLRILSECKTLKALIVSKDNFKVSETALKVFNQAVPDCKLDIQ